MLFDHKVYSLLKNVPYGKITTYKEIAHALDSKAYRAVGNALNRNKEPDVIPCYKVVRCDGSLGGFAFGVKEKIRMLGEEGIIVKKGKVQAFEARLFRFNHGKQEV